MLLENNTERVMNLVDIIDDLNGINKVRLPIHILEENCFSTKYDESFIRLLKEVLEIIYPDTIFCGYKRMEREIKIFF